MVDASRDVALSPVVVAVPDMPQATRLFRLALDEAMTRTRELVVLDHGTIPLRDAMEGEPPGIGSREQAVLRALSSNPHVRLIRTEPVAPVDIGHVVRYCETIRASLLVLAAEQIDVAALDAALSQRLFGADFDLLVVTDHPAAERARTDT